MSQHFELRLPNAPFIGAAGAAAAGGAAAGSGLQAGSGLKAGEYSYDYSPPVTPLETPGGGYDRTSYFSSATLNTLAESDGDVGEYGKDGKKGGGIV